MMKYLMWNYFIFLSLFFLIHPDDIKTQQKKEISKIQTENSKLMNDSVIIDISFNTTSAPEINNSISHSITEKITKNSFFSKSEIQPVNLSEKPKSEYSQVLDSILRKKEELKLYYEISSDKNKALDSVGKFVVEALFNKVIPYWYGTRWSMSGSTQLPKQGYVGCSYFVCNTMSAIGFKFDRCGVARASSRNIARTFQLSENVVLLKGFTSQQIVDYVKQNCKEGFYTLGLDYHVEYLLYYQNVVYIIHSGRTSGRVEIENAETSAGLNSNRHYIGEITTNENLMLKWLYNEYIPKIEVFEFSKTTYETLEYYENQDSLNFEGDSIIAIDTINVS